MDNFDKLLKATKEEFESEISKNPLFEMVLNDKMTLDHYVGYLRETYHMVRHTPRMLSLAGARLGDEYRDLRNWFFEQVEEENNHDLFCIKDVKNLGLDPKEVFSKPPLRGSWGLISQNYYMATYGNPVGILGVASLTEGLGAQFGDTFSSILVEKYGLKKNQVSFLKSHGGFDVKHMEEVKIATNTLLKTSSDLDAVIHGRRMTIYYYSQMFKDVLSSKSKYLHIQDSVPTS